MNPVVVLRLVIGIHGILRGRIGFAAATGVILRAISRSGELFRASRWGGRDDEESAYVKSTILLPAIYLVLKERFGTEIALPLIERVIVMVSTGVDSAFEEAHGLHRISDPLERWKAYRRGLSAGGFGRFNRMEDEEPSPDRMSYTVRRCIFHDCFTEAGAPEITRFICDYDRTAHERLFPELAFSRDGSWENSIGHGKDHCRYLWEKK